MIKKVFVNGTFDILHPGHVALLTYARSLGDFLLVAVDSDDRVRSLKNVDRPVNDIDFRIKMLESLKPVNRAVVFNSEQELEDIVREYAPDFMVIGSDYKHKRVVAKEHAKHLIFFDRDYRYSSTQIIDTIKRV